jgi:hypothetical protein
LENRSVLVGSPIQGCSVKVAVGCLNQAGVGSLRDIEGVAEAVETVKVPAGVNWKAVPSALAPPMLVVP